jgi:hypothetical protein
VYACIYEYKHTHTHIYIHAYIALRTPEERLDSGAPKEEFGRMIFENKSSLGDLTKFQSTTSACARGGAGTCDAPCRLGRVLDSACMQAKVRLSCTDGLIYTGRHTFRRNASPRELLPRNFGTVPQRRFF